MQSVFARLVSYRAATRQFARPFALRPIVGVNSSIAAQQRQYSQKPFQHDEKEIKNEATKKRSFRLLIILGLLAVGSTLIANNQPGKGRQPKEALESSIEVVERRKNASAAEKKISVIFVLGGPGAGKGTQCAKLVKDYGFVHLSAGDLLREEQNREGSQYGQLIADYIKAGKIVPQEVTIGLLDRAIKEAAAEGKTRFLVDGFPRKMDQAITFEEKVAKSDFTLFFECTEKIMLDRLLSRGKTSGRADDNVESIKKRFRTFVDTSMPVVEYFEKQGRVVKLQCDRKPDEVYATVQAALKERGVISQ